MSLIIVLINEFVNFNSFSFFNISVLVNMFVKSYISLLNNLKLPISFSNNLWTKDTYLKSINNNLNDDQGSSGSKNPHISSHVNTEG
jgi:hypothetical protein